MLTYEDYGKHNLIINTVCEHMTSEQYNEWLDKLSKKRIVLQSNDYFIIKNT